MLELKAKEGRKEKEGERGGKELEQRKNVRTA